MSDGAGDTRRIEGTAAFAAAAGELADRARREIALLSLQLPDEVYGTPAFTDAVKRLILESVSGHASVRVLIQNPGEAATGNRLVTLGQEMTSFVAFRQPAAEHAGWQGEWLIIDQAHVLERPTPDHLTATCHTHAPAEASAARRRFDELWAMSEATVELRRLHLC